MSVRARVLMAATVLLIATSLTMAVLDVDIPLGYVALCASLGTLGAAIWHWGPHDH